MKRSIKWIVGILGALLLLVVLAALALLFWVDPNIFRDDFEALARKQGVVLQLEGPLSWRFFPELQIVTQDTRIAAPPSPDTPIATFDELSVSVALWPLLDKQIQIEGLSVDGLSADLYVDEQGHGNWEQLGPQAGKEAPPTTAPEAQDSSAGSGLAVEELAISNGQVRFRDKRSGTDLTLKQLELHGSDIKLGGENFPLQFSGDLRYQAPDQLLTATLAVEGGLSAAEALDNFALTDGKLRFDVALQQGEQRRQLAGELGMTTKVVLPEGGAVTVPMLELSNGQLKMAIDGNRLSLSDLQLSTAFAPGAGEQKLSLSSQAQGELPSGQLEGKLDLSANYSVDKDLTQADITGLKLGATVNGQRVDMSGNVHATLSPLSYRGDLKITPVNPRALAQSLAVDLPPLGSDKALSHFDAELSFSGDAAQLALEKLFAHLDSTELSGSARLPLQGQDPYQLKLTADVINLDHYLPPQRADENSGNGQAQPPNKQGDPAAAPTQGETEIDLSPLADLSADVQLSIGQLLARDIPFSNLNVGLNIHGGKLKLNPLRGTVYDGPFTATATVDAVKPYTYAVTATAQQLPVGKVLKALELEQRLSGIANVDLNLNARGNTVAAIEQSLDGEIVLKGSEFVFQGINVERAFCQLVAAVQGETFKTEGWPSQTAFQEATTRITFNQGVAKIQKLNAGVSRLALSGEGKINLRKSAFDLVFNTKLTGNDGEGLGCTIENKKLLDRNIPIRCKADFEGVSATTCLPDMRVVEDMAKEKVKDKVDDKAKELLQEKLGTERGEAAKELFKLFKK